MSRAHDSLAVSTMPRGEGPRSARLILAAAARPLRFGFSGAVSGLLQLTILVRLIGSGWGSVTANGVAFIIAAQVNFALSSAFTWRDRSPGGLTVGALIRRWLLFHRAITGTACLNLLVFGLARSALSPLPAAALGIAAAAGANYLLGDRLVFIAAPLHASAKRSVIAS